MGKEEEYIPDGRVEREIKSNMLSDDKIRK